MSNARRKRKEIFMSDELTSHLDVDDKVQGIDMYQPQEKKVSVVESACNDMMDVFLEQEEDEEKEIDKKESISIVVKSTLMVLMSLIVVLLGVLFIS